jgi:hypothetical protein
MAAELIKRLIVWVLSMQDAVKVMAKSLIRNRHAVTKLHGLKSQLQAISLRIAVSEAAVQ